MRVKYQGKHEIIVAFVYIYIYLFFSKILFIFSLLLEKKSNFSQFCAFSWITNNFSQYDISHLFLFLFLWSSSRKYDKKNNLQVALGPQHFSFVWIQGGRPTDTDFILDRCLKAIFLFLTTGESHFTPMFDEDWCVEVKCPNSCWSVGGGSESQPDGGFSSERDWEVLCSWTTRSYNSYIFTAEVQRSMFVCHCSTV